MARGDGRNLWIAVPAGLVCAAVVGALVYLSLPMVPVTIAWAGDTLRRATTPQPAETPRATPAEQAVAAGSIDCRTLYSDELWNELLWREGSLLNQTSSAPATEVTTLTEALTPTVLVTCRWRVSDDTGIVTTLAKVDPDAATIAEAALASQGFRCEAHAEALTCARTRGAVVEEHTLRDGLWLASVETGWHPEEYGARLERGVFG